VVGPAAYLWTLHLVACAQWQSQHRDVKRSTARPPSLAPIVPPGRMQ
jgi:hypothetical protein